jgi:hypothetical protein
MPTRTLNLTPEQDAFIEEMLDASPPRLGQSVSRALGEILSEGQ